MVHDIRHLIAAVAVTLLAGTTSPLRAQRGTPGAAMGKSAWAGLAIATAGGTVRVTDIYPGSPAEVAGIRRGDTLLFVAGVVASEANLMEALRARHAGEMLELTIGSRVRTTLRLKLEKAPVTKDADNRRPRVEIPLDSLRERTRGYLDFARAQVVLLNPAGFSVEHSDSALILRNDRTGSQYRLDSILRQARAMSPGETQRSTIGNANVNVMRATDDTVYGLRVTQIPARGVMQLSSGRDSSGVLVTLAVPGSRGASLGVRQLDVLVRIDATPVRGIDDARTRLSEPYKSVTVLRSGTRIELRAR